MTSASAASEGGALVGERAQPPRLSDSPEQRGRQRRRSLLALAGFVILLAVATFYHYAIYVPQPKTPHRLALLDDVFAFGVFSLVALVGFVLGKRALRPFRLSSFSRLERGALAMGLGWGILSLAVLAIGLAHLLYGWLLIAGLALVLAICWRDAWRVWSVLTSDAPVRWLRARVPQGWFLRTLVVLVVIELLLLATQALTMPVAPHSYDDYQYHWAVPELYLLHHAIYALPGWAHANFPFNSEMLNTLALACESPVAAAYIQATFGLLAMLLIVGFLARRFGSLAAWLGLALCVCNNLFAGLLISGYAELAVTYYAVAALVVLLAWLEDRDQPGGFALLCLTGLFAGFGLGAKYTEGQTLVGLALLLIGVGIVQLITLRRQGKRFFLALWSGLLLPLIVCGLAAGLAVLPWLLRDWAFFGNPIYPLVWGGPEWDAARTEVGVVTFAHFGPQGPAWKRLLTGFFALYNGAWQTDEPTAVPPNFLYPLVVLIPLIWAVVRVRRRRQRSASLAEKAPRDEWGWPWLVVASGGYLAWLLSGAAVGRYTLPWLLMLSVPTAVLLARTTQVRWQRPFLRLLAPAIQKLSLVAVVLAAVLAVVFTAPAWAYVNSLSVMVGNVSLRQWEERVLLESSAFPTADYIEQHVPHDARLLIVGQAGLAYFLPGFDYVADSGEDWIPYLETEGHTPAGIVALLRQDHFRYLVYEEKTLNFVIKGYGNYYLAGFLPGFRQFLADSLIQVWSYQNFHVYQVPSP